MVPKLNSVGTSVLPVPWNTPPATMDAPYIGSAKASMRRTRVPKAMISGSGVNIAIICGAKRYSSPPVSTMTAMPSSTVTQPNRRAICRRPAPTLCPTTIAAAL